MQSKLYLLLVILSVLVICSLSTEPKPRRNDSALDFNDKKKVVATGKENSRFKNKYENIDDDDDDDIDDHRGSLSLSSYADNRYSPFGPPEGNYRTRSRWPGPPPSQASALSSPPSSSYDDDYLQGYDWSRLESRLEPRLESRLEPRLESRLEPRLESRLEPRLESRLDPRLESRFEPRLESRLEPRFESRFEPRFEPRLESRLEFPSPFSPSLPSVSFDSNPSSNGPTCHSLVDPQYPIFSDVCGAVPQARYFLPNSLGHRERWQVAQILTGFVSSSQDPACTRSLRLLLCPVLFPPCPTRHEPPPILPCQSYCRAVKSRCAIPTLDLLPCEVFPYSSDLCPTNQAYGSFLPPGSFPSVNQPPPLTSGLPSSNYPMPRSYPSLQSLISSQGLQSALTPPTQSTAPLNLYSSGPYATESLTPVLADFPSRSYTNDYRQGSRYSPLTRSSTETRPTADTRSQTETRTAAVQRPSVIKA